MVLNFLLLCHCKYSWIRWLLMRLKTSLSKTGATWPPIGVSAKLWEWSMPYFLLPTNHFMSTNWQWNWALAKATPIWRSDLWLSGRSCTKPVVVVSVRNFMWLKKSLEGFYPHHRTTQSQRAWTYDPYATGAFSPQSRMSGKQWIPQSGTRPWPLLKKADNALDNIVKSESSFLMQSFIKMMR